MIKLKDIVKAVTDYRQAQHRYVIHPGGGASQKIKNALWETTVQKGIDLDKVTAAAQEQLLKRTVKKLKL